jgi:hypothetical protein
VSSAREIGPSLALTNGRGSGLGRDAYLCEGDDVPGWVSDADFFRAVERGADGYDDFGSLHRRDNLVEIFHLDV